MGEKLRNKITDMANKIREMKRRMQEKKEPEDAMSASPAAASVSLLASTGRDPQGAGKFGDFASKLGGMMGRIRDLRRHLNVTKKRQKEINPSYKPPVSTHTEDPFFLREAAVMAQDALIDSMEHAMQDETRRVTASVLASTPGMVSAFLKSFDAYAQKHCFRTEHPVTYTVDLEPAAAGGATSALLQRQPSVCVPADEAAQYAPSVETLDRAAFKSQDALIDAIDHAQYTEVRRMVFKTITQMKGTTGAETSSAAVRLLSVLEAEGTNRHWRSQNPLQRWRWELQPVPASAS